MRAEELFEAIGELDYDLMYSARARYRRRGRISRRAVIAASFVILFAAAALIYGVFVAPTGRIYLDSKTSVMLTLNSRGRVLSAKSYGADQPQLSGRLFDEAARELISDMCISGAISNDENTLLIGFDRLSKSDASRLLTLAEDTAKLNGVSPAIIAVSCTGSSDDEEKNSPARDMILSLLCGSDSALSREDLRLLSVNELALLLEYRAIQSPDIHITGEASDSANIGFDAAAAKALSLSSFKEAEVSDINIAYSAYRGRLIYLVRLSSGQSGEAYFINAATGATELAVKAPSAQMEAAVEREIRTVEPERSSPTLTYPSSQTNTESHTVQTEAPAPSATERPAQLRTIDVSMTQLSFVTITPPGSAEQTDLDELFTGQCFYPRAGEEQNQGSVTVISSADELRDYLRRNAYSYSDPEGNAPDHDIDESYFADHSVIAISGVFTDASYYALLTDIRSDGERLYLEASLGYGEAHSGEYYCRALSLYGVDRAKMIADLTIY